MSGAFGSRSAGNDPALLVVAHLETAAGSFPFVQLPAVGIRIQNGIQLDGSCGTSGLRDSLLRLILMCMHPW